jgi:hypothetical protein
MGCFIGGTTVRKEKHSIKQNTKQQHIITHNSTFIMTFVSPIKRLIQIKIEYWVGGMKVPHQIKTKNTTR